MSLDRGQVARTRDELVENLRRSHRDAEWVATVSGLGRARTDAVLAMRVADPADVWLVADLLTEAIRADGGEPLPFSALTERSRPSAEGWFGIRPLAEVRALLADA